MRTFWCLLQACLSKEQENRVRLELRITEMEEELESHTHRLSVATETQQQLQQELVREKEESEVSVCIVHACMYMWHFRVESIAAFKLKRCISELPIKVGFMPCVAAAN